VLHTLRLKGFAQPDAVASATGMSEDDAAALLEHAVDGGLAVERDGRVSGYTLTATGRARQEALLSGETGRAGKAAVRRQYERFLGLNRELLSLCTDWQVRPGTDVAARLATVDDGVQPICAALTAAVERFRTYGPRLYAARHRFEAGDTDWLTKPLIDSYHTVWFELHEDLLCTLGIDRSKEEGR
jgi:hypothetical protein